LTRGAHWRASLGSSNGPCLYLARSASRGIDTRRIGTRRPGIFAGGGIRRTRRAGSTTASAVVGGTGDAFGTRLTSCSCCSNVTNFQDFRFVNFGILLLRIFDIHPAILFSRKCLDNGSNIAAMLLLGSLEVCDCEARKLVFHFFERRQAAGGRSIYPLILARGLSAASSPRRAFGLL
jgi:hypothetical protein